MVYRESFETPAMNLQVFDATCLRDEDTDRPGVYLFASPFDSLEGFSGAEVFLSTDSEVTWTQVASIKKPSTLGVLQSSLGSPASTAFFDHANTVSVFFFAGTAYSASSDVDVLAGDNKAIVGDEVIHYLTATAANDHEVSLTTLVRGTDGTEEHSESSHLEDTRVILVEDPLVFLPLPMNLIGQTLHFRAIASGGVIDDAVSEQVVFAAGNLKPHRPTAVKGSRNSSNDLTVTWNRRTRNNVQAISAQDSPLGIDQQLYEVSIKTTGGTLLRSLEVAEETLTYTAAQQTSDGITPGDSVILIVGQAGPTSLGAQTTVTL